MLFPLPVRWTVMPRCLATSHPWAGVHSHLRLWMATMLSCRVLGSCEPQAKAGYECLGLVAYALQIIFQYNNEV